MTASAAEVAAIVVEATRHRVSEEAETIRHCTGQLTEEQMWQRPFDAGNTVANLILHLCGNLRQWIISGIGGASDVRDRPSEFSETGPIPKAELLAEFDQTIAEVDAVLADLTAEQLVAVRRIQGFETSVTGAIFDSVPHLKGHSQEIIHMTRSMCGDAYKYRWTPQTREEGAPE